MRLRIGLAVLPLACALVPACGSSPPPATSAENAHESSAEAPDGGTSSAEATPDADPPPPIHVVHRAELEANRIAGGSPIAPPDEVMQAIKKSGTPAVGAEKLCIDERGAVSSVTILKSTGYEAYDQTIVSEMRTWRYRPFLINGKPAPVCTAVTFIYRPGGASR